MKKLPAIGLAIALVFATVSATSQPAKADVGTFLGGMLLGVIVAPHVYDHHYRHYPPRRPMAHSHQWRHIQWCEAKYRTYNRHTDLYYYKPGKQRHCRSPYSW